MLFAQEKSAQIGSALGMKMNRFIFFAALCGCTHGSLLASGKQAETNAKIIESEFDQGLVNVGKIRNQLVDTLQGSILALKTVSFYNDMDLQDCPFP